MVNSNPAVFLFVGNDSYSKERALRKLSSSFFDKSSENTDCKVFDGKDALASDILSYLHTIPLIASRRLAAVRHFEKLPPEDKESILDYIKKPVKTSCLVIDIEDESSFTRLSDAAKYAVVSRFGKLSDQQFQSRAKEILSACCPGKDIARDAVAALKELCSGDLNLTSQELDKLSSYVGDRRSIELSDVEDLVGNSSEASAFALTDAIESGDLSGAFSVMARLTMSGKEHHEIVGLLCWQVKRLYRGRVLLNGGMDEREISGILKIGMRYSGRFFKQLKGHDIASIKSRMATLLDTDAAIKLSGMDQALALEFAVIKLCLGLR